MSQKAELGQPSVSVAQVSIVLGDATIQHAMDFTIEQGEFVAVLGPNGAGKSTLLKLLLGLLRPTEGEIRVLGRVPRTGNQQVGYLPQFLNLESMNTLRARDIVGFGFDGHRWGLGLFNKDREKRLDQILEEVDALSFSRAAFDELSGGERQRLLLAQALISDLISFCLMNPLPAWISRTHRTSSRWWPGSAAPERSPFSW